MEATLRNQLVEKIARLPEDRIREVLSFIDLIQAETSFKRTGPIRPDRVKTIASIEATESFGVYCGNPQEIYSLGDGEPVVWKKQKVHAISKRRLVDHLNDLVAIAKSITSDVKPIVVIPGVEGQHAWINIFVPDDLADQIDELVAQRAHDIFMTTGYDIGIMVYEKSQVQLSSLEKS